MEAEPETKVLDRESTIKDESASVRDDLGVGKTVGRYALVHRLGHGGMAVVYLGRATGRAGFEKLVAVKVIHPHLAAEPEFVEMFLDEARIAARLHHPHVVEIHDLGEDRGVFFMVMEYVEGETLASVLRQLRKQGEHLPLSAVLQVVADACEGLAAAHDLTHADGRPMHLVHRDVSPHNLLVGMDGRVKVVDFGIAKATGRRSSTRTGQLRGKLAYMSPEQAGGQTIDHRTDLFALGAVLWELLTNERLFTAETESETLARVNACEVPDIRKRREGVPEGVAALVSRALARDPDRRFATAQDMLRELRAQIRLLDDELDPRANLSEVMERLFAARVGYIRAAVRRASESSSQREPAANDPISPEDATQATNRPAEISTLSGVARRSSGSMPAAVGPGTNTHTLTASLATAPARHWSLWLLLPLVGAVVGAAIVSGRLGPSEPRNDAVRQTDITPTSLPVVEREPVKVSPVAVTTVKWRFDTDPDGATIILDGAAHPVPSPVTIEVPRGDEPIEVVISKDGYRDRVLHPAPLAPGNFTQKLEPLPAPAEDGGSLSVKGDSPRVFTARKKDPDKAKDGTTGGGKDDGGKDDETSAGESDIRTLPPKPDFKALRDKHEGSKPKPHPTP